MAKPTVPYIVRICTLFSTPSKNDIGSVRLLFFCFNSVWTTTFATAYILWLVDGAVHLLASIASSIAWLFVNTALWVRVHFLHPALPPILIIVRHLPLTTQAVASGFMQHTRRGGNCAGVPTISRFVSDRLPPPPSWSALTSTTLHHHSCRQSLTVEALGWTELGLSALTLLATCFWSRMGRRRRSLVSDSRRLV